MCRQATVNSRAAVAGEGGCQEVWPGQSVARTLSMAVRATRREGARAHGHMADSAAAANTVRQRLCRSGAMWSGKQVRSVKPSAQPTLVRTQHLPPPAKTARSLRKRGPAGRFLLVPPCVIVCRCRSWRSDRYGHIADSVRAEGAVRGTACFADPRPFCPVIQASGPLVLLMCRTIPAGSVLRRPARSGRRAGLVRACGCGGLPDRPAPSHRGRYGGVGRVPDLRFGGSLTLRGSTKSVRSTWKVHQG